ncbi:hypothetical protein CC2G_005114 [Coprinopsis cinerea AmutBmut pab1-1]|nr:hypothetical protein CC2G_005114 [Coprinopsis cinerea AmutBmut pab1-1]
MSPSQFSLIEHDMTRNSPIPPASIDPGRVNESWLPFNCPAELVGAVISRSNSPSHGHYSSESPTKVFPPSKAHLH